MKTRGIERALENQQVDSYYDLYLKEETSRYVFRILAIKEIAQNPLKYGFRVDPKHLYREEPLRFVEVNETIRDLVSFAKQNNTNYKLLKRHNPWLREDLAIRGDRIVARGRLAGSTATRWRLPSGCAARPERTTPMRWPSTGGWLRGQPTWTTGFRPYWRTLDWRPARTRP